MKKKIDVFNVPLTGTKIIEASAGTGKTFTIIILYLRLLLGINNKMKCFSVTEILIVTFTNTMKEELITRIKKNIYYLRIACIQKKTDNPIFNEIISHITNLNHAIILLFKAEHQINEASIFTIHSFCLNTLQTNQYQSDIILKKNILDNIYPLYYQATCDFWRTQQLSLTKNISEIILQYWKNPESLLKNVLPIIKMSPVIIKPKFKKTITITKYHQQLLNNINSFKKKWLSFNKKIIYLINNQKNNKHIYSKNNMLRWINKITIWANENTYNYYIPKELNYFTTSNVYKNTLSSETISHDIFKYIEIFLTMKFSLKEIFLSTAIKKINYLIKKEKKKIECLEFDDLLIYFLNYFKKYKLFKTLHKRYPITIIDECQDINVYQYKIFKKIYCAQKEYLLIYIGDPKQSIYTFRGSSIFTYFFIKSKIKEHYYLDTNWRASYDMNNSINILFSKMKNPFCLSPITFKPTKSPKKNINLKLIIKKICQPALRILINTKKNITINDYQQWIAKECASSILYWLSISKQGDALIKKNNLITPLKAEDITILVRNKNEAKIIKKSLDEVNINSTYCSNNNNIYKTTVAKELLYIFQSILEPNNEKLLKRAMITNLLNYNIYDIDNLHKKYQFWSELIDQFNKYKIIWNEKGIYSMIRALLADYYYNYQNITNSHIKNNTITNIIYISELLQNKSRFISSKHILIFWFKNKIFDPIALSQKNYIPQNNYNNCINIVTFHKSKGLEYNITWIPFSIYFPKSQLNIYHSKNVLSTIIDFSVNQKNFNQSKKEMLSEEIRLIYVALTRSIIHCSIGIAPVLKKYTTETKNSNNCNDLHLSALGYILQSGHKYNIEKFINEIKKMSYVQYIEVIYNTLNHHTKKKYQQNITKDIYYLYLNRKIQNYWCIASYTTLKNIDNLNKEQNIIQNKISITKNIQLYHTKYDVYHFPKGMKYGTFLHKILKLHNFKKTINIQWLINELEQINLSKKWSPMLQNWITEISHIFFMKNEINLYNLPLNQQIKELEFYLSISNIVTDVQINKLFKYYHHSSYNISTPLSFNKITGMLTGSIDFIFYWKKKYYIIDYKTNWLGNSVDDYNQKKIKMNIIQNRYDLQYQLYSLALHRYLQHRIKNYQFKLHFGGVFIWFLRAIHHQTNGIFYTLPQKELIEKLHQTFN
ncbi:exodeoxyribonuclease V subunit beta [Buchnera aphidicola (Formosaphis micheliae)]|uniref:exodeoxyribonuclease V subunit beta n=1 Tax=Buchnera aphidicola TaxID=9 RepID=UPI0031CCB119